MPRKFFYPMFLIVASLLISCSQAPEEPETPSATPVTAATTTPIPTVPPVATLPPPTFEAGPCPFGDGSPGLDVECGTVTVPEIRGPEPTGTVTLTVAIMRSRSETPASDPIIYLDGGPGGYTLEFLGFYRNVFAPLLVSRDIIFFDQRGIGYAEPSLNCPELEATVYDSLDDILTYEESNDLVFDALQECRQRLEGDGVQLNGYTTAESAADVNAIREALGIEQLNLIGISYGTLLAQAIIDRYEADGWIRTAVLDSVVPQQAELFTELASNASRSIKLLTDRCAADANCGNRLPDLEQSMIEVIEQLNQEPATIRITHPNTGARIDVVVDGYTFYNAIFLALYDRDQIMRVPGIVTAAEEGNYRRIADSLQALVSQTYYTSEAMSFAVLCASEFPFTDQADIQSASATVPDVLAETIVVDFEWQQRLCREWQISSASARENQAVVSDIPTLILAGDYDPITPPAWGRDLAETFTNSTYAEFLGTGHAVLVTSGTPSQCAFEMTSALLNDPATPPETACLDDVTHLRFFNQ